MKKNILLSFLLMVVVAVTRFLITLSIARHWPKGDVGYFNLIVSLSFLLSVFGLLGQHLSLVRFFSSNELRDYNWKKYLIIMCLQGAVIALVGSIVSGIIYQLGTRFVIACFVMTSCVLVQEYCASLFRARQKYYLSLIIGQFMPVAFMAVCFMFLVNNIPSLEVMLIIYILVGASYSLICLYLTFAKLPSGTTVVPVKVRKQGYILFGVAVTFVLFNQADIMLVAGLINVESLAIYTVILSLMRIYDFASLALNHVLVPKMKGMSAVQLKKIFYQVLLVSFIITFIYLMLGNKAVQFLYKGKYDDGLVLIPLFCVAGIFKLLYTIPSSYIAAISPESTMKSFLYINIAAVIINYLTNIPLILTNGIAGAAISSVVAWFIRVSCAYMLTHKQLFLPGQATVASEIPTVR